VQPGDTLHKIAVGARPQGVNLDQVLVGIFRRNPDAFINNNMNLLRTGKILRIPEASELGQVTAVEAAKESPTQLVGFAQRPKLLAVKRELRPARLRPKSMTRLRHRSRARRSSRSPRALPVKMFPRRTRQYRTESVFWKKRLLEDPQGRGVAVGKTIGTWRLRVEGCMPLCSGATVTENCRRREAKGA
jgi:FimV-like protein